MPSDNNGQLSGFPTYTTPSGATTAIFSNGQVRQPVKMAYDRATGAATVATGQVDYNDDRRSNWAMTPGAQTQLSGTHLATGARS